MFRRNPVALLGRCVKLAHEQAPSANVYKYARGGLSRRAYIYARGGKGLMVCGYVQAVASPSHKTYIIFYSPSYGPEYFAGKTKSTPGIMTYIVGYCPMCARPYVYSRGEEGEGCELST